MDPTHHYIARDRLDSMARGVALPERARGAALFADISGFTPMAEALAKELGRGAGAEVLLRQLNHAYESLISEVHRYTGSVIGFSGDAVTCWFDEDTGERAVASALAMMAAVEALEPLSMPSGQTFRLSLKVAITAGQARRFCVGNPDVQKLDVLAGKVVARLARAERLARPGEVILTPEVAELFGTGAAFEDRFDEGERFRVLHNLSITTPPATGWPDIAANALSEDTVRPWLLPSVYQRLKAGQSDFLAELRVATPLFLRFHGLDYDHDENAPAMLDRFVRWVQGEVTRSEGTLLQLTVSGDKGDYLYIALGGPIAHEDDTERALKLALTLVAPPPELTWVGQVQIGISRGLMRTGAYGSSNCRTYGIQGDDVNLAARLMQAAAPGQILVSNRAYQVASTAFLWERGGELRLKGKAETVQTYRLLDVARGITAVQQGGFVGRVAERALVKDRLDTLFSHGSGGVIVLEGEPGIGKSRLLRELASEAQQMGATVLTARGDAIEHSASYHAFRHLFEVLLDIEGLPLVTRQEKVLARFATSPEKLALAPLLNAVLPLSLPENERTSALNDRQRAQETQALLVGLLAELAEASRLVVLLEDAHWFDSASWRLLLLFSQRVPGALAMLGLRSTPEPGREQQQLRQGASTTWITLDALAPEDSLALVMDRLGVSALPEPVATQILAKAQGNPFFCEELAYALRDEGVIRVEGDTCHLVNAEALKNMRSSETIQGVVTSRIDRLEPPQQLALKVGSVIGRSFLYRTVHDVHPVQEDRQQLADHLDILTIRRFTLREEHSVEPSYQFKHAITQDVAYHLMLSEQRRQLHRALASWYEQSQQDLAPLYPILAHHLRRAIDERTPDLGLTQKALGYASKAGAQALSRFAHQEAFDFFRDALSLIPLLPPSQARDEQELRIRLGLARPLAFLQGIFAPMVGEVLTRARELADALGHKRELCMTLIGLTTFHLTRGDARTARKLAEQLVPLATEVADPWLEIEARYAIGISTFWMGGTQQAREHLMLAITLHQQAPPRPVIAVIEPGIASRCYLALIQARLGFLDRALATIKEAIAGAERLADPFLAAWCMTFLILVHLFRGERAVAMELIEVSWARCIRGGFVGLLSTVAPLRSLTLQAKGEREASLVAIRQSIERSYSVGNLIQVADAIAHLARAHAALGQHSEALQAVEDGLSFGQRTGITLHEGEFHQLRGEQLAALSRLQEAEVNLLRALEHAQNEGETTLALRAALGLSRVWPSMGKKEDALVLLQSIHARFEEGLDTPLLREAATRLELLRNGQENIGKTDH